MLEEVTTYHGEVFSRLPQRLAGEPPQNYLATYGPLVAKSSRIMDPWIQGFGREALGTKSGKSLLDLGCGSGGVPFVLRSAARGASRFWIELHSGAATAAASHLQSAGCSERFSVQEGDMRRAEDWPEGSFDVISANQNVYYFTDAERRDIWAHARSRLNPAGQLTLVTPTAGGPLSSFFALILGSSVGCQDLPTIEELEDELQASGFDRIHKERLIPGDSVWGLSATLDS